MRTQRLSAIAILLLLAITLTAWFVPHVTAGDLFVPQDYPTIQAAINAAGAGDTIHVSPGTYHENVIVNKTVTIIGASSTNTIVDGDQKETVFKVQADDVEISQLTIRNGGSRYYGVYIYLEEGISGVTVRNNKIMNNVVGVFMSYGTGSTIEGNLLSSNSMYGVDVKNLGSNTIRKNTISQSAYGIEISDSPNNQVTNNTVSDCSYGVYVAYSNSNNVSANTLSGNSWNLYFVNSNSSIVGDNKVLGGASGIQIMRSENNAAFRNAISESSYGIYLGYCGANTINDNAVSLNDWGIDLYYTTGSTIKQNLIAANTWGFYLVENSKNNYIYHNDIISNIKQAVQDSTSSPNYWRTPTTPYQGNYWSDYKGQDTDGDGIGNTYLPWAGVDWYPLISPWGIAHDVAVTNILLSSSTAYIGDIVQINVTAKNEGTETETFDVTAKYENTTRGIFGTIATQTVYDLNPSATTTLTFDWNTIEVQPCVYYTIKAEASVVEGEIDTADNFNSDGMVKIKMVGDVNGDGIVDVVDLSLVAVAYGTFIGEPSYDPEADLNKDGVVDVYDISTVSIHFGDTC